MRYFHVPPSQISDDRVKISGREFHHLANVLRLQKGDEIVVLDGLGGIYKVRLISRSDEIAVGNITDHKRVAPPHVWVNVCVGLPKSDKMDLIVQKCTELGAYRIVPVLCQHSVSKPPPERTEKRIARWQQIAVEASKQSHRSYFPLIPGMLDFHEALSDQECDLRLIFAARPWEYTILKDVLKQNKTARKVELFIGPEGGFSEDEISLAISSGALPVSLGGNILRTETAAIAALAIVLYEMNAAHHKGKITPDKQKE
jgi:16S rRNA (uracil1498-N3)-methyltransferase